MRPFCVSRFHTRSGSPNVAAIIGCLTETGRRVFVSPEGFARLAQQPIEILIAA